MVTELSPGMLVGRYRLKEAIAQGGMGSVWSAIDTRLTRTVAVKLLPRILVTDPSAERRFEREARAMSRLQHANVVSIYDVGSADPGTGEELPFLVMELIRGESLDKILDNGSIEPRRAARILGQVGRALGAAHEAGVVHRDLKPSNVMVSESDHVKVLDFGLARLVCQDGHTPEDTLTTPGMVLGSCPYMAPEQALGQQVTPASDIFSCGAVLYEALSGQRTFNGSTPMRVLQAVVRCEYDPLSETAPSIQKELVEIVDTCLNKDPSKRLANGTNFANVLFDLVDNGKLDDDDTKEFSPGTIIDEETPPRKTSKRPLAIAALLATLLIGGSIGGALGVFFGRSNSTLDHADSYQWSRRQLLDVNGTLQAPAWHPGGEKLVVLHQSGASSKVLIVPARGGEPRTLLRAAENEVFSLPRFSPDGAAVVIGSRIDNRERLRIISTSHGTPSADILHAHRGTWIDNDQILYSGLNGMSKGLYIHNLETGEEKQLEVPDPRGSWRYGLARHNGDLALIDKVASKSAIVIFSSPDVQTWLEPQDHLNGFGWAPSGDSIIAAINGELVHISAAGVTRIFPALGLHDPCFSPDGRTISAIEILTPASVDQGADGADLKTEARSHLILFDDVDPAQW